MKRLSSYVCQWTPTRIGSRGGVLLRGQRYGISCKGLLERGRKTAYTGSVFGMVSTYCSRRKIDPRAMCITLFARTAFPMVGLVDRGCGCLSVPAAVKLTPEQHSKELTAVGGVGSVFHLLQHGEFIVIEPD